MGSRHELKILSTLEKRLTDCTTQVDIHYVMVTYIFMHTKRGLYYHLLLKKKVLHEKL